MTRLAQRQLMFMMAVLASVAGCAGTPPIEPATMVVRNGPILTMDPAAPEHHRVRRAFARLMGSTNDTLARRTSARSRTSGRRPSAPRPRRRCRM